MCMCRGTLSRTRTHAHAHTRSDLARFLQLVENKGLTDFTNFTYRKGDYVLLSKQDAIRIHTRGLRKKKRSLVMRFFDRQPDIQMEWSEWTRRFTEYMKNRKGEV